MNVLEHRYRREGQEGRTFGPLTETDMIVVGLHVKQARDVRVQLGDVKLSPAEGLTRLPQSLQVKSGSPIAIDFMGEGSVELLGVRVPRTKTMGPLEQDKPCPVCALPVQDLINHRCGVKPK